MSFKERLFAVFSIDLRTLALVRVLLGILLIADLLIRSGDLSIWLSDSGVFPRNVVLADSAYRWSFYFLSGSWLWALTLNIAAGFAALLLIVGYNTRLATFVSLLLLISLHNRAPVLLQGGDNLLLCLVFWSCFLPLGARYSVDAALLRPASPRDESENSYLSVATVAILLQVMAVYFFSAFLKSSPDWLDDGTAIYYALHLDQFARVLPISGETSSG